tara:strand:- start:10868 stop:11956 length:1089 start_codon:yes stop_codon:yes gene_type:complete
LKLFFDPSIFYLQRFGGISRYIIELNKNFSKNFNTKIIAPIYINNFLDDINSNNKICFLKINNYLRFTRKATIQFNKFFFELFCFIKRPDIVHLTYYDNYNYSKNIKTVITVHDLIHEKYSSEYNFKYRSFYKKNSIEKADKIICVSDNTKKDLLNFYKVDENKISVIHHGYPDSLETIKIHDEFLEKPFLLFVGDRNNYKNFKNFILAYSKSKMLKNDFNVVCFGGGEILDNEKKIFLDHNILDKIKIYYGDDKKLNYLFKKAAVYVCPSLYEGFGLTILEAMKFNCPIVSSNGGSLIEVGKDVIDYFDPKNIEDMIYKIETLAYDDERKQKMIKKYSNNLKNFDWKKTSYLTENLYKSLY